jgi:hypothetical protein
LQKDVVLFVPKEVSQDFQKSEAHDRQTTPQILVAVVEPKQVVFILRRTRKETDSSQSFRQKRRKTAAPSHFII